MEFIPTIHYHSKNDRKNAPLALRDFLSLRENDEHFAEKYVIDILKCSRFFYKQNLVLVENQSNKEPDIIDKLNKNNKYEIKTFWNKKGCEMLSLEKDFDKVFKALNFDEDLEFQFNNWNKPENYNETSKSIIKKMKNKPMNYILFMIQTFCLDDNNSFTFNASTDIDILKWQHVLKINNFDFMIYIIKPTLFNQFAIYQISKNSIDKEIINYDDFFKKYITIEKISMF